ncbi:MAG: TorF family putative porin [Pseudomonadota bacterium]
MLKKSLLVAALTAAFATPAMAGDSPVSFNAGLVSDYLVRGISQTSAKPALQAGVDYAHESGFYLGAWGSNISWITDFGATGTANIEIDTYGGFSNSINDDTKYNVGYIRYNYLGSYTPASGTVKADTQEIYGAMTYKWLTAKYSYSLGDFLTVANAKGTNYIELNGSFPFEEMGFNLDVHAGKQTYVGKDADNLAASGTSASYSDYSVKVSKDFSGYVVGAMYSSTNASGFYTTPSPKNKKLGRSTVVLSVTHSF